MKRITRIESSVTMTDTCVEWGDEVFYFNENTMEPQDDRHLVFFKMIIPSRIRFTQEQLQIEFNYMIAEKITKTLLGMGLITNEEFTWIMAENRRIFPTFLAPLL